MKIDPRERFCNLTFRTPDDSMQCWHWRGARDSAGYGVFSMDHAMHKAHRASYMLFIGPLPGRCQIRQTCANRLCVNPAHLRSEQYSGDAEPWQRAAKRKVNFQEREKWPDDSEVCAACGKRGDANAWLYPAVLGTGPMQRVVALHDACSARAVNPS